MAEEDAWDQIPVNRVSLQGDSVIAQKFVDENVEEKMTFSLAQLSPPETSGIAMSSHRALAAGRA